MKRDYLAVTDFTTREIDQVFQLCRAMKQKKIAPKPLEGKTVGCIFHKASLRTRISFEVGVAELGGRSLYITEKEIELGVRESIYDAAKVLSRYLALITIRTFSHDDVVQLAQHADVPVINALTDLLHPCQILGDAFTIIEKKDKLDGIRLAYLGDGNNVANSLMNLARRYSVNLVIGTSKETMPDATLLKAAQNEGPGSVSVVYDAKEAVSGADVIYTDVWASMGQKHEAAEKAKLLGDFQVNDNLLKLAKPDCIVMHCLPAVRNAEITDSVMDGPNSVVFEQAENRLHIQKAIMLALLDEDIWKRK
ncbi:MAG: ornithine carbamoyltransferase [candidate division Zixibacteria bacterium]|nr:ornithine carbamoyltransferase [candidate division Zixibacteria bacterium]